MRRRDFILASSLAAAWPLAARAQQSRVYRVGALVVGNADVASFRKEISEELRRSGYIEGQNLVLELRSAEEKLEQLPKLAAELVDQKVDVIVALYTPCAIAAKQATHEIPIVILSGDPLGTGLVPSLSRPGGNVACIQFVTQSPGDFDR